MNWSSIKEIWPWINVKDRRQSKGILKTGHSRRFLKTEVLENSTIEGSLFKGFLLKEVSVMVFYRP